MRSIFAAAVVLVMSSVALAGDGAAEFPQGSFALELAGSYVSTIGSQSIHVSQGTLGVHCYVLNNLSLGVRGGLWGVDQPSETLSAGSLEAMLRWHPLRIDRFTLYMDIAGGRMWADGATPPGGTTYNCVGRTGAGLTYRMADKVHLLGGARYFHYSNGNEHGGVKNPSYDGLEAYAGIMFTLGK